MPSSAGACDAFDAGDAVVDGDDQVGGHRRREIDDFGRQPVAVGEAVGDQVVDGSAGVGSHGAQCADADGAGGGTVAVVVGDDQDPGLRLDGVGQQHRGVGGVGELRGRDQRLEFVVELKARLDPTRRVEPREQRVQPLLSELPFDARRHRAGFELGHWRSGKRVKKLAAASVPPREWRRQRGYRICREVPAPSGNNLPL